MRPRLTAMGTSLTHWGGFTASIDDGDVASVTPLTGDADPSPALGNLPGSIRHISRITGPAVRRGWLEDGPGPSARRGSDDYVAVTWNELTELTGAELRRVIDTHGNGAVYGGSYGWASAGRFHHAQSQVHRFLNCLGGYTFSRHSYSLGATGVIMPRVVGTHDDLFKRSTQWNVIVEHTDLLVCFGGLALKNTGVNHGGTTAHPARAALDRFRRARWTDRLVLAPARRRVGPLRVACRRYRAPTWRSCWGWRTCWPPNRWPTAGFWRPTAPVTTGSNDYLLGIDDGVPKSPRWAAAICGLEADEITALARRMAAGRTIVTLSWSLQRTRYGEQAPWMGVTLAAMLGQIGLPGGGFGHGYGSMNEPGLPPLRCALPRLPQGLNPVTSVHSRRGRQRHAAEAGRTLRLQRTSAAPTPTSSWCTGPAATRFTTTRTSPGCAAHWHGRTRWWCTTRTGPRWPDTPTSWCRPRRSWNATTSPARATTPS